MPATANSAARYRSGNTTPRAARYPTAVSKYTNAPPGPVAAAATLTPNGAMPPYTTAPGTTNPTAAHNAASAICRGSAPRFSSVCPVSGRPAPTYACCFTILHRHFLIIYFEYTRRAAGGFVKRGGLMVGFCVGFAFMRRFFPFSGRNRRAFFTICAQAGIYAKKPPDNMSEVVNS